MCTHKPLSLSKTPYYTNKVKMIVTASAAAGDNADETNETKFIVTGFGPFGGVPTNPTKVLVEKLQQYWTTLNDGRGDPRLSNSVLKFIQIETSAEDVRAVIHRLKEENKHPGGNLRGTSSSSSTSRIVLLHLGIDVGADGFKLERCAWNDATFRIPDEQGFRPQKEKIVKDQDFEQCTTTSLDLEKLSAVMKESYPKIKTSISTDAGRFVCNYVYCTSLDAFQQDKDVTSLFLHVPSFGLVNESDQLAYVTDVIRNIAKSPSWNVDKAVAET